MKKILIIFYLLFVINLFSDYSAKQIIVKTKKNIEIKNNKFNLSKLDKLLEEYDVLSIKQIIPNFPYYTVNVKNNLDWNYLNKIKINQIEYMQPNYLYKLNAVPNDPLYENQVLQYFNYENAWDIESGKSEILIGLIDSGLSLHHPDLQHNIAYNQNEIPEQIYSNIDENQNNHISSYELHNYFKQNNLDLDNDGDITNNDFIMENSPLMDNIDNDNNGLIDDLIGWDFTDAPEHENDGVGDYLNQDNNVNDETWHGTHIAGIIAADTNNNIGISGICWNASIIPLKAGFRSTNYAGGMLQDDDIASAMVYAIESGADIINMSWGDTVFSPLLNDICNYGKENGVLMIAATGNSGSPEIMYPARLTSTIAVGSINAEGIKSAFSNYGPTLDIMAPGSSILSCIDPENGLYGEKSGTSMATPHVTATIALMLSLHPELTNSEIKSRLFASVDKNLNQSQEEYGNGILNPEKFLKNNNNNQIEITYPTNNLGFYDDFTIKGTVHSDNLKYFTVTYRKNNNDHWKDVETHLENPTKHYNNINNDNIATFNIQNNFEQGDYYIKVELIDKDNQNLSKEILFTFNNEIPNLINNKINIEKRFLDDYAVYIASTHWNYQIKAFYHIRDQQKNKTVIPSLNFSKHHEIAVPRHFYGKEIEIKVIAQGISGLTFESNWFKISDTIDYHFIYSSKFKKLSQDSPMVAIANSFDLNNNNKQELIMMTFRNASEGIVNVYEQDSDSLKSVFTFKNKFWPKSINISENNTEMFASSFGNLILYKNYSSSIYPILPTWNSDNAGITTSNAIFADYDNDYQKEYLIQYRNGVNSCVGYFNNINGKLIQQGTIQNNSDTDFINQLSKDIVAHDFNNNGLLDVVIADLDADLMVYEIYPQNNGFSNQLKFSTRLPINNIRLIEKADTNNDGIMEIIACGVETNTNNYNNSIARLFILTPQENDDFKITTSVAFSNITSNKNSITVANLDDDDNDEIILTLTPNVYILEQKENEFKPTWIGKSNTTYQIGVFNKTDTENSAFVVNQKVNNSLKSVLYGASNDYLGPNTPKNFQTYPLSQNSLFCSWHPVENCQIYKIQLVDKNNNLLTFKTKNDTIKIENLNSKKYFCSMTAINNNLKPNESEPTETLTVKLKNPPKFMEYKIIDINKIKLKFNAPLNQSANILNNYILDSDTFPTSAISESHRKSILLVFNKNINEKASRLRISNLKGDSGTPIKNQNIKITPNTSLNNTLKIIDYKILDSKKVTLTFSNEINQDDLNNINNYKIIYPDTDINNYISKITSSKKSCTIEFKNKLKRSHKGYCLIIKNIKDIYGNFLNNENNKITFNLTQITNLDFVEVIPNPVKSRKFEFISWINIPTQQNGEIFIYDLSGNIVFKEKIDCDSLINQTYSWNLFNNNKKKVSSGLYFYILKIGKKTKKGKISIIN